MLDTIFNLRLLDAIREMSPFFPLLALIVSMVTGYFGIRGFLLSKTIQSELKSDEVLIPGELYNPSLMHPDHENCVIQTTLFNKSKRKAHIFKVQAFDAKGLEIDIAWSDRIDQYGNPQGRERMIGVIDSSALCIRRNDGSAFRSARVEISHSLNAKPLILKYEIDAGWQS